MCPIYSSKEESREQEEIWQEQKKYHAARYVWNRRGRMNYRKRMTYGQWWEKMFNDDLEAYAEKLQQAKNHTSNNDA
tara:strand:+ start:194 stop:424 length:231 start_codon:yes stop_codon:yes gene_type:complete